MAEGREHFVAKIDWTAVMRYDYPSACQVIRRLMPSGLGTLYDPEDFVADAIAELFARPDCFSAELGDVDSCCQAPDDRRIEITAQSNQTV